MGVYVNWAKFDPWFSFRMIFHLWHPNSPLSHPGLTRRAFFSEAYPERNLITFQQHTNRYEAFWWPLTMLRPFSPASAILKQIHNTGTERVMVMAGTGDRMMTPDVTRQTAAFYREASEGRTAEDEDVKDGVRLAFVQGAGHHLQNDVPWRDGAEKLLKFYKNIQG